MLLWPQSWDKAHSVLSKNLAYFHWSKKLYLVCFTKCPGSRPTKIFRWSQRKHIKPFVSACYCLIRVNTKWSGESWNTLGVRWSYKQQTRGYVLGRKSQLAEMGVRWLRAGASEGLSEGCCHQMGKSVWDLLSPTKDRRRQMLFGCLLLAPPRQPLALYAAVADCNGSLSARDSLGLWEYVRRALITHAW